MSIQPFDFQGRQVRTVLVDGELWFVGADVARVLGYSATAAMTRSIEDDERGVQTLHTPSGDQDMTVVNEPGLYSAILRSRVPQAKAFKRWVTHEVLPRIRRTGQYGSQLPTSHPSTGVENLTNTTRVRPSGLAWLAKRYPSAVVA